MILDRVFEILRSRTTEGQDVMETQLSKLDEFLDGGIRRKELIVLGGKTGSGKSYLACQLFAKIARQGFKCAYFSLEISNEMVVSRMLGMYSNLPAPQILFGMVGKDHIELLKAEGRLEAYTDFMHFYDDMYSLPDVERILEDSDFDFVVIDFIQNVLLESRDEYSKLTEVSLRLQKIAKKKNLAILALSQLSNKVANQESDELYLEYKGSSAIAMVADLGFFLVSRPADEKLLDQEVDLILKKNRRGPSERSFPLLFKFPQGVFYEK